MVRVDTDDDDVTDPETTAADIDDDALGEPAAVPRGGLRHRLRTNPSTRQVYRVVVFTVGLLCIAAGFALSVLPGPLTIPPVLLGLWVWSTEFGWAQRLFERFKVKGRQAWDHAKRHPISSTAITVGGIVAVVVGIWAIQHFQLVAVVRGAVGL
ncbi:putative transmembrane protein PGPGW [Actinomycetospora succinea]|uniref:Putative transmembrane protein PGPGW n=1 Tax=Actinomycetospora succinea TaxID=663603 RepID=A0A4R6VEG3_9PSEU|nr:PGPGW domain-containing protein [Actinomycetospora succinea]TDQ58898.1 putative transmembrane protein PGPGW [Actinomycetospora succinea]